MERINQMLVTLYLTVTGAWEDFKESERGDTNFVSILLILAIVIILAIAFYNLGDQVMNKATDKVTTFLNDLG